MNLGFHPPRTKIRTIRSLLRVRIRDTSKFFLYRRQGGTKCECHEGLMARRLFGIKEGQPRGREACIVGETEISLSALRYPTSSKRNKIGVTRAGPGLVNVVVSITAWAYERRSLLLPFFFQPRVFSRQAFNTVFDQLDDRHVERPRIFQLFTGQTGRADINRLFDESNLFFSVIVKRSGKLVIG